MSNRIFHYWSRALYILLFAVLVVSAGCNSTRHLPAGGHLLRSNNVVLTSEKVIVNKGEMKDNLYHRVLQKPNYRFLRLYPTKVYLYNMRYKKLRDKPADSLSKWVERPVVFDSALMARSAQNMRNYLFNEGYFYATVTDTVIFKGRKAYVQYHVNAGSNYLINRINYDIDDSAVALVIRDASAHSTLQKGKEFRYAMLEEERSRLTTLVRNNGYYRFSQENVSFKIDTIDKESFKIAENPFENAINYIAQSKSNRKQTIDIDVIIRPVEDSAVYTRYTLASVTVYPDYKSVADQSDTTMIEKEIRDVQFWYHNEYVHPKVLYQHIFLNPGNVYSQADYDKTHVKLNELGIFQFTRIQFRENRVNHNTLDATILLNRSRKYDFSPNVEVSSGSTYAVGSSVGVNFRDRNFMKGANLLTISVNGGLELSYLNNGEAVQERFHLLTEYYNVKASIDFPKFLSPIGNGWFDKSNVPHTVIGGSETVIDRIKYFTLNNVAANLTYNWHETQTKIWSLSPGFVNIIHTKQTDSFKKVLAGNEYLQNSYRENFIEGENINFRFDNIFTRRSVNYSYIKVGLEEAGALLNGINSLGTALNKLYSLQYAEYGKLDFDFGHYFTLTHSVFAFRFLGGIGLPYGKSPTLPYIKQYFAGGPYSLRGWRIRTLGPGSFFNDTVQTNVIDRTGDIKLEVNGEYRFPITPLFAGAVKMNGALFADAGNIWLARPVSGYPGGELNLSMLGQTIAADVGAGARFDIASFLTFRLDLAMPVKKPYVLTNGGWVLKDINFGDPSWRARNLVLNVSIGYPF